MSVVVESGAFVSDKLSVEGFTSQGVREHFLSTFPNMEALVAWTNEADLENSLVGLDRGARQSRRLWCLDYRPGTLKSN